MEDKEITKEQATKGAVAPIDLSTIKNLDVASEKDASVVGLKNKVSTMKKKKSKFCFLEANKIPLLSGGRYYQDSDDEDLKNGYIKLYPFSLAEEEILTNQAYLKSGSAFRILFDSCMASNYDSKKLLSYDVMYLLYALRNISYGSEYKFDCKCAECGKKYEKTIDIEQVDWEEIPAEVKDVNTIKLPVSKYTVTIRLSRLADEEETTRLRNLEKYDVSDRILELYVQTLEILDNEGEAVDPKDWIEFYTAIPSADRLAIYKTFEFAKSTPKVLVTCPKCGSSKEMAIPLEEDFFRLS